MKTKIFLFIAVLLALSLNACQTAVIPEEAPEKEIVQQVVEEEKGTTIWAGFDPVFPSGSAMYTSEGVLSYAFTTEADNVSSAELSNPSANIHSAEYYAAIYPSGTPINLTMNGESHKGFVVSFCFTSLAVIVSAVWPMNIGWMKPLRQFLVKAPSHAIPHRY